jgi:hypothetical protein
MRRAAVAVLVAAAACGGRVELDIPESGTRVPVPDAAAADAPEAVVLECSPTVPIAEECAPPCEPYARDRDAHFCCCPVR